MYEGYIEYHEGYIEYHEGNMTLSLFAVYVGMVFKVGLIFICAGRDYIVLPMCMLYAVCCSDYKIY